MAELLRNDHVVLSAISVFELRLGESAAQTPSLDVLFEAVRVVPFDQEIARRAARIYADLEEEGRRIGLRDTFIAATALSEGLPLYTLNQEHFQRVEGLEVLP